MKVALDTNILAYSAGIVASRDDRPKVEASRALIAKLMGAVELVAPVQVLGELFHLARRRTHDLRFARESVVKVTEHFETVASTHDRLLTAIDLATEHKLQLWDALIVTAAADAGCSVLLSEDMQDGLTASGLTVANPFAATPHPRLAALLSA